MLSGCLINFKFLHFGNIQQHWTPILFRIVKNFYIIVKFFSNIGMNSI